MNYAIAKKYKLYWMYDNRIPHQDPLKDGYIGVTSQTIGKRVKLHRIKKYVDGNNKQNVNRKIYEIIKDIPEENLEWREIIWSYDRASMEMIERAFRPQPNIGWNVYKGGQPHGKSRPVIVTDPHGNEKLYPTLAALRKAGLHDGTASNVLQGRGKTFSKGHKIRYAEGV